MQRRQFLNTLSCSTVLLALSPRLLAGQSLPTGDFKADWISQNGLVYTMNASKPGADTAAVRGNKIMFVGDAQAIKT